MDLRSCINTTPISISDASLSISNDFIKLGKVKTGVEHNFSFKKEKKLILMPPLI
jgi:hypothetical protein